MIVIVKNQVRSYVGLRSEAGLSHGFRGFRSLRQLEGLQRLRSPMGQKRQNRLALVAIENDVPENLQFTDAPEDFVSKKLRKANV